MTVQSGSHSEDNDPLSSPCAGERRERIIDAALALFAHHGVEGTTMKMLAKEARISAGLTYHYFASKSDLLDQVICSRGVSFPELAHRHHESIEVVLPEFAVNFGRSLQENLDVIWVFFREYRTSKTVAERIGHRRDACENSLINYLKARQEAKEVREISPSVASRLFLGALFQVHLVEEPTDDFIKELVDIFLAGIRA